MFFIAQFKDGTSFTGKQGYWDDCPDNGITALHVALPFSIKKRLPDGQVQELEPSTVMFNGYEDYYFCNRAKASMSLGHKGTGLPSTQYLGVAVAAIDYSHDFVLYTEIDTQGNVTQKRYTVEAFFNHHKIQKKSLRKGNGK